MKQRQTFILLGIIVAVLILGVAYAAIQNVTLSVAGNVTATPDQGNFKVAFTGATASGNGGSTQSLTSETSAIMNVYGLTSVGDTRTVVFTIANTSTDITAYLSNTVTHNNTEYFKVTATLGTTTLAPVNGTTTLTITVELIKTPITGAVTDTITASITASPTARMISFYLESDENPLYALEGMTWEEWINSEYYESTYFYGHTVSICEVCGYLVGPHSVEGLVAGWDENKNDIQVLQYPTSVIKDGYTYWTGGSEEEGHHYHMH